MTELDLSSNAIGAEGLSYLARALPLASSLKVLDISGNDICRSAWRGSEERPVHQPLQELMDGLPDSNLRALDLGNNSLTGGGTVITAIEIIARGLTNAGILI